MSTAETIDTGPVTREELVERARKLAPTLAERARETELRRSLLPETAEDIRRNGFVRAFVAEQHGGYALEFVTVIDVARELGRACANTAWCTAIFTLHNRIVSAMPDPTPQTVFGADPNAMVCGVVMPAGFATPVDGGHRLTGAWDFASGCDHSGHAVMSALIRESADAPPSGMGMFLVDRDEFRIEDNWHVSGLCGTGSKRVHIEDVFVPAERSIDTGKGVTFGQEAGEGSLPLPGNSVATLGLVGVAIGAARGALDRFEERLRTKLRAAPGKTVDHQVAAQLRFAESCAEVDGVELMAKRDCEEMTDDARAGRRATWAQRGRYRRDAAWAMQVCARATARLQPVAGAHAIFLDDPLQRAVRDTATMSAHVVADWDTAGESFSRAILGLPLADPIV